MKTPAQGQGGGKAPALDLPWSDLPWSREAAGAAPSQPPSETVWPPSVRLSTFSISSNFSIFQPILLDFLNFLTFPTRTRRPP